MPAKDGLVVGQKMFQRDRRGFSGFSGLGTFELVKQRWF